MKKPNVFIIGAPKCGTTSLANWLGEHPQVYFCPIKEPHFFNFDYGTRTTKSIEKYEELFRAANARHLAVCEASTRYLYSRTAVPAILSYAENARLIIMLRDPVELAQSLHQQRYFNGDETEPNFETAWELQKKRLHGECVPLSCRDPQLLQYGELCKLGKQVQRAIEHTPIEQILLITLNNLKSNPRKEYLRVLNFLGLEDDQRTKFPATNAAKSRRLRPLLTLARPLRARLKKMGIDPISPKAERHLENLLTKKKPRPEISPALKREIESFFEKDKIILNRLVKKINKDT